MLTSRSSLLQTYILIQYASPAKAAAAVDIGALDLIFAFAAPPAVKRALADIRPNYPTPEIFPDPITKGTTYAFSNDLLLIHDFITPEEEVEMINRFHADASDIRPGKRQSLHYGPHFDYTTFAPSTSVNTPPPEYLSRLLGRLPLQGERDIPDQFTIQYYPPRAGIPPHVDTHSAFEEALYSLSFGAGVPMQFRRCGAREARRMRLPKRSLGETETAPPPEPTTEEDDGDAEEWELVLPARSLLVMRGASRWGFTHGIKGRRFDQEGTRVVPRQDRYSVTMRRIKPIEEVGCDCPYPAVCDWRIRQEREADIGLAA